MTQPPAEQFRHDPADAETPTLERTSVLADFPEAPRAAVEQRWQAFARLMTVDAVALAPLVRVAPLPEGAMLTHRVPAGAVALADLRASGPMRAGQVLTVAVAVADALVALAEDGLAHGGVAADQVLVGPDGAVVLGGCGLAWHRAPGDVDGPRLVDDVAQLGELVRDLLGTGSSPSSLVLAALRAADPDPALRPTPIELLGLLRRCGRADSLLDLLWTRRPHDADPVRVETAAPTAAERPVRIPSRALVPPPREPMPREPVPWTSAARLRIDPRTAPAPVEEEPFPDEVPEPAPERPARRAGVPRRPAARERRRRSWRGWRGPLVLVLVSALAALALAAVRVGARAMADVPVAAAVAAPVTTPTGTDPVTADDPPAGGSTEPEPTGAVSSTSDPSDPSDPSDLTDAADAAHAADPTDAAASTRPAVPAVGGLDLDRGATTTAPDWRALLTTTDAGRQQALAAGDTTALAAWVDPDGPAWVSDAALAARVTAAGARIDGGDLVVLEVRPRRVTSSDAVLLVRDRREAYSVVTAAGTSKVDARGPRWWQVTLRRTTRSAGHDSWRIRDARAVQAPTR